MGLIIRRSLIDFISHTFIRWISNLLQLERSMLSIFYQTQVNKLNLEGRGRDYHFQSFKNVIKLRGIKNPIISLINTYTCKCIQKHVSETFTTPRNHHPTIFKWITVLTFGVLFVFNSNMSLNPLLLFAKAFTFFPSLTENIMTKSVASNSRTLELVIGRVLVVPVLSSFC